MKLFTQLIVDLFSLRILAIVLVSYTIYCLLMSV